jgi:hypothetical protein
MIDRISLILIIIIIIVFILFISNYVFIERFEDENPNLVGYHEGLPPEYMKIDYGNQEEIWRRKQLDSLKWETRFPYMVKQRYSYDDTPYKNKRFPSIYNQFAYLKELPLELKNRYYAELEKDIAMTSLEYYPDVSNQKYRGQGYASYSYPIYNECADPTLLVNPAYDIMTFREPIYGYDYDHMYDITATAGDGTSDFYDDTNGKSIYQI